MLPADEKVFFLLDGVFVLPNDFFQFTYTYNVTGNIKEGFLDDKLSSHLPIVVDFCYFNLMFNFYYKL